MRLAPTLLVGLSAFSLASPSLAGPKADCTPTYQVFSKLEARRSDGWSSNAASVLLVGCSDALLGLQKEDLARIRTTLLKVIDAEGMGLWAKKDGRKFRRKAVAFVNAALGRNVIADVFFFGLGHADYEWAP